MKFKRLLARSMAAAGMISILSGIPVHAAAATQTIHVSMSLSDILGEKSSEELSSRMSHSEETESLAEGVLNREIGTVMGPSGKETYYNLDMSGVVAIMRNMGNNDPYWIRSDGCKMLGDYIMVAANLDIHPRGSLVDTSLGKGVVTDTGDFASDNVYQIDIATNW